jgi:ApbE superfamily uncharacterized protein (UPF0280 family)
MLPGNRLHLNEGPIDLVIWADGTPEAVAAAYRAAERRFDGLLAELVAELALLRAPLCDGTALLQGHVVPFLPAREGPGKRDCRTSTVRVPPAPSPSPQGGGGWGVQAGGETPGSHASLLGPIARRMAEACWPHRAAFITPMAAVAGAVAEAVLAAMTAAAPLARAYVNDGGDIALHLTPGASLAIGVVRSLEEAVPEGGVVITHDMPVRGIATSGRRGRSFSLGIADAATVLARGAPEADAAATLIANAVNVDDPAIVRRPARALDPDSDLGDLLVTVEVGPLPPAQTSAALDAGVARAEAMRRAGLIEAALLALAGEWRSVGGPQPAPHAAARAVGKRGTLTGSDTAP